MRINKNFMQNIQQNSHHVVTVATLTLLKAQCLYINTNQVRWICADSMLVVMVDCFKRSLQ